MYYILRATMPPMNGNRTVGHTCDDDHLALEASQILVVDLKLGHGIDTTLLWGWRRKVFAYKPSRSTSGMLFVLLGEPGSTETVARARFYGQSCAKQPSLSLLDGDRLVPFRVRWPHPRCR